MIKAKFNVDLEVAVFGQHEDKVLKVLSDLSKKVKEEIQEICKENNIQIPTDSMTISYGVEKK